MTLKVSDKENSNAHPFIAFSEVGWDKASIAFAKVIYDQVQGLTLKKVSEGGDYEGEQEDFNTVVEGILSGLRFLSNEYHALIKAGEIKEEVFEDDGMEKVHHLVSLFSEKLASINSILQKGGIVLEEDANGQMMPLYDEDGKIKVKETNTNE